MTRILHQLRYFLIDTKLAHIFFTLPFLAVSLGLVPWTQLSIHKIFWIGAAFFCARTFALGINRIVDRHIDSQNPRTHHRKLASRVLSHFYAKLFTTVSGVMFVLISGLITLKLIVPAIMLIVLWSAYPYGKRIHWFVHGYLGVCLGLLPIAVALALSAEITWAIMMLSVAITCWVTGFDLLYATHDLDFDRQNQLYSVPAQFGTQITIIISSFCFAMTILALAGIGIVSHFGLIYHIGVLCTAGWLCVLLILATTNRYLIAWNSWVGVIYGAFFFLDGWW